MNERLVSFAATIAYGLLALAGLLVAGLVMGDKAVVVCALLATGAAYLAQAIYTGTEGPLAFIGGAFQGVSCLCWFAGLLFLI